MPKLTINDIPLTQSDMMNRDHGEFIIILNRLIDLTNQTDGNNNNEIDSVLDDLKRHTEEHFAREEGLMVRADFPPYAMHKGEHDRVLTMLRDTITHWKLNRDRKVMNSLANEQLPQWLLHHVATMDSVTSQFLANHGVLEETT